MAPRILYWLAGAFVFIALLGGGCGGGGKTSEDADPAAAVPADAMVFTEFPTQPGAELKRGVAKAASAFAGIANLDEWAIVELEESVAGKSWYPDLGKEVFPWLGTRGGVFAQRFDGESLEGWGAAFEVSNEAAAQEFVDSELRLQDSPPDEESYEGVDFHVLADTGGVVGVFNGLVAVAEDETVFKSMVEAMEEGGLDDEKRYADLSAGSSLGKGLDAYVDIGELIDQAIGGMDPSTSLILDALGIDLEEAAAFASIVPHDLTIEADVTTNLSGDQPFSGDKSGLLASLPDNAFFAVASPEFGRRFKQAFERIDEAGIPGSVSPGQLSKEAERAGIDPERIADSVSRAAFFLQGITEKEFGAALVLVMESPGGAQETASELDRVFRSADLEFVGRPVVVASRGDRVTIGLGSHSARTGLGGLKSKLSAPSFPSAYPARHYGLAKEAIGDIPITGSLDLWDGLDAAASLLPPDEKRFSAIRPYLELIFSVAVGVEPSHGLTKLRVSIGY